MDLKKETLDTFAEMESLVNERNSNGLNGALLGGGVGLAVDAYFIDFQLPFVGQHITSVENGLDTARSTATKHVNAGHGPEIDVSDTAVGLGIIAGSAVVGATVVCAIKARWSIHKTRKAHKAQLAAATTQQ